jgi:hypothetical protein
MPGCPHDGQHLRRGSAGVVGRPGLFAGFRKAGEGDIK